MEKTNNYLSQLNITRFIAAIVVVFHHFGKSLEPFNNPIGRRIFTNGPAAVIFFFVLSGFVLSYKYHSSKIDSRDFYFKRFARLYPMHFIATISTLLVSVFLLNIYPGGDSVILQIFAIHAWLPKYSQVINYPSWSITNEFFFYLLFPFIVSLIYRVGLKRYFLITVLIILLIGFFHKLGIVYDFDRRFIKYFPVFHLNSFMIGVLGGIMHKTGFKLLKDSRIYNLVFILTLVLLGGYLYIPGGYYDNFRFAFLPVFFLLVIFSLSNISSGWSRILGNKFFVFLGYASYSIYLFQVFIFGVFEIYVKPFVNSYIYFYGGLCSLIIMSCFFYYYIERKIQRKLLQRYPEILQVKLLKVKR